MRRYETHVGLTLEQREAEGIHSVLLYSPETAKNAKPLYAGTDKAEATALFNYTKEHYEQRQMAAEFTCDDPECTNRGKHTAEAHVLFVRWQGTNG